MGWAYGTNAKGREVGYGVEATCDQDGCEAKIDRGLGYVCGGMHDGDEHGCGDYFCTEHLFLTGWEAPDGEAPGCFLCKRCCDEWDAEHPDPDGPPPSDPPSERELRAHVIAHSGSDAAVPSGG